MSGSRDQILSKVRHALEAGQVQGRDVTLLDARLADPTSHLVPARAQGTNEEKISRFIRRAEAAAATVVRVAASGNAPEEVAAYLRGHNLPSRIVMADDESITGLDWSRAPAIQRSEEDPATEEGAVLSAAAAGVAETGTLVMSSAGASPLRDHLLSETNIVVLRTSAIVGGYEEIWAQLRRSGSDGFMPRSINFITGPSRTADIEQTLELGAHGPARLHIILMDEDGA